MSRCRLRGATAYTGITITSDDCTQYMYARFMYRYKKPIDQITHDA